MVVLITGVRVWVDNRRVLDISYLFADDTIVFCDASFEQLGYLWCFDLLCSGSWT